MERARKRKGKSFPLGWVALAALVAGCQSAPATGVSISPESSLLAVEVVFPARLRDPALVEAFLVKGPIHTGVRELPELVPSTFVKRSRAYWLDPEPGTYSLVAVRAAYAPPWNERPVAGVEKTRWTGTSADTLVLPAALIHRTRTTIGRGGVGFLGALRLRKGDAIDAGVVFDDLVQRRVAERLRPEATEKSGLAGWLERAWLVNAEESSLADTRADRQAFLEAALDDLGASPWRGVVARELPPEPAPARAAAPRPRPPPPRAAPAPPQPERTPPPSPEGAPRPPTPSASPAEPEPPASPPEPEPSAPPPEPSAPTPAPQDEVAARSPEAPAPERRPFPGLPPGSPLAAVEAGMSHYEVRDLLGEPDERIDRTTARAWIPFYTGPGAYLRDWVYEGEGRVVFSLDDGALTVVDVVPEPDAGS